MKQNTVPHLWLEIDHQRAVKGNVKINMICMKIYVNLNNII